MSGGKRRGYEEERKEELDTTKRMKVKMRSYSKKLWKEEINQG